MRIRRLFGELSALCGTVEVKKMALTFLVITMILFWCIFRVTGENYVQLRNKFI